MATAHASGGPLQTIYSFFLGLVTVAFVGIGVYTFYPEPKYPTELQYGYNGEPTKEQQDALRAAQEAYNILRQDWALYTSIILLICATVILVISLIRSERLPVISNGLLLGGVFTMIYAVIMTMQGVQSPTRFAVVTVALITTVGIGYLKFAYRKKATATAQAIPVAGESAAVGAAVASELALRVAALEAKLDAAAKAWR